MHRLMGCNGGHTYRWSRPAVSPVTLFYDGSGAKLHFGRDPLEGEEQTQDLKEAKNDKRTDYSTDSEHQLTKTHLMSSFIEMC